MIDNVPAAAPASIPETLAGTFRPADRYGFLVGSGGKLRVASWNVPGTRRGTVIVLPGRAEFIEKYATETVAELLGRGFAVEALDWRGQGLSDRALPDRHKGHIDGFATYVADLRLFLDTVLTPQSGPVIVVAHSMGGHMLMRYLAEHDQRQGRGPVSGAVLTAPMTGLKRETLLRGALMLMPERPSVDTRYLYGSGPYSRRRRTFASNMLTHDERRFRFTDLWFAADPRLAMGGPTAGWARQAIRSMRLAAEPGYLERIDVPVTVVSAGEDRLVDSASHARIVARMKRAELVTIARARHEILMETDAIRAQFWDAFDRLVKRAGA